MSNLIPWLSVLAVGGGAFLVGKHLQGKERKRRELRRQQQQANLTASTTTGFAYPGLTIRASMHVHPMWTQGKAQEKTQGKKQELGSIQGQQPEQSGLPN